MYSMFTTPVQRLDGYSCDKLGPVDSSQKQRLAEIAACLYAKKDRADRVLNDVVSAVSGLGLPRDRQFERCIRALYQCAERDGVEATADRVAEPFFRLTIRERIALMGTHIGKISYHPLYIGMLMKDETELAETLWVARQNLVQSVPNGGKMVTPECPEYHVTHPWTQNFLDEETQGADRVFLEQHMKKCDECRATLFRARQFVFQADRVLREMKWEWPIVRVRVEARSYDEVTVGTSVKSFLGIPKNLIMVLAFLAFMLFLLSRTT